MMIYASMIYMLEDEEELKIYIETIIDNVQNRAVFIDVPVIKPLNKVEQLLIVEESLSFPERIRQSLFEVINECQVFPYSDTNQPPSNSVIPVYVRKEDSFTKEKFSDCVDVTLLNICNCLLYDSIKGYYSLETIKNKESDLYKFYDKNSSIFTITDEIRKDWSQVIQDLENFTSILPVKYDKYKLNHIAYVKKSRNEVDTGIINMMNVLIKIFEIDHAMFWNDFKGLDNIEMKLEELFKTISPNPDTFSLNFYKEYLKEEHQSDRLEIFGSFAIEFDLIDFKIEIYLDHSQDHVYIEVREYKKTILANFKIEEVARNNLMSIVYMNFVKPESSENDTDMVWKVYFSGRLHNNNSLKREILFKIFDYIGAHPNQYDLNEELKGLNKVILSTVNLNDRGNFNYFKPCFVYCDNLTDLEIEECWSNSFVLQKIKLCRLWESRVLNIQNKTISIDFGCPTYFSRELGRVLKQRESIKFSNQTQDLFKYVLLIVRESLTIQELDIAMPLFVRTDNFQSILESFSLFRNLRALHLRFIQSISDEFFYLMNQTLQKLTDKLTCFGISLHDLPQTKIGSLVETVSGMPNLEKLCIYFSQNQELEIKHLINQLYKIKQMKSLKLIFDLNFYDIFTEFSEIRSELTNLLEFEIQGLGIKNVNIKRFRDDIWSCSKLEKLVISKCFIESDLISDLFTDYNGIKKLRSFNIQSTQMLDRKNLYSINSECLELLKKQKDLKHLEISDNNFCLNELTNLIDYLSNLENLRILNISALSLKVYDLEDFASKLAKHTKLENLDISKIKIFSSNQPNPEIFDCLLIAIGELSNLSSLDISQKFPSLIKSTKLVSTVQKLANLTFLNIRGWFTTDKEVEMIRESLPRLKKFVY